MYKRDIIIQIGTSVILCALLSIIFVSFEYSSQGSKYMKTNIQDTIPFLLYFIVASIPSMIIGLFVRINKYLLNYFRKNYWINITCCLIGIGLSIYSLKDVNIVLYEYRMDGMDFEYWHPRYSLQVSGWFIIIFSTLNLYLPHSKMALTANKQKRKTDYI